MHANLAWLAISKGTALPRAILPWVMSIETGLCSHTRALRGVFGVPDDAKCSLCSEYLLLSFPPGKPDTWFFMPTWGTAIIVMN